MIYLDNNATTRPSAAVADAVGGTLLEFWANPSSMHRFGQGARAALERARGSLAALVGARAKDLTFTGSGTEAIDLAIRGVLASLTSEARVLATSRAEHHAVQDLAEDLQRRGEARVVWLPLAGDRSGRIDVAASAAILVKTPPAVISVQWANNETGVIQPVEEIGTLARTLRAVFHCDATQWVGKMPVDLGATATGDSPSPFDLLTFSPHKFHGPKGVGVLWARRSVKFRPLVHGTQELGKRGGTENVPGIVGAGVAADEARAFLSDPGAREKLAALRDQFEALVLKGVPRAVLNSPAGVPRLWNTSNIGFARLEAEALLLLLSERGVCASAGAACSSGSLEPSPVLLAMGIEEELAHGSLRFSISRETTEAEVVEAAAIVVKCVHQLATSSDQVVR